MQDKICNKDFTYTLKESIFKFRHFRHIVFVKYSGPITKNVIIYSVVADTSK